MDVSEIGFRERYQNAITLKTRARNVPYRGGVTEILDARNPASMGQARNVEDDAVKQHSE